MTSSAWVPIEPVEPRISTLRGVPRAESCSAAAPAGPPVPETGDSGRALEAGVAVSITAIVPEAGDHRSLAVREDEIAVTIGG
ncbi:hypothetical protein GCM10027271_27870 [Saccharopolyspora gloriosae]